METNADRLRGLGWLGDTSDALRLLAPLCAGDRGEDRLLALLEMANQRWSPPGWIRMRQITLCILMSLHQPDAWPTPDDASEALLSAYSSDVLEEWVYARLIPDGGSMSIEVRVPGEFA